FDVGCITVAKPPMKRGGTDSYKMLTIRQLFSGVQLNRHPVVGTRYPCAVLEARSPLTSNFGEGKA
ncbi:MAG: hypothetical protein QXL15_04845, partial [Candidatus Korarchaeota archaeon]